MCNRQQTSNEVVASLLADNSIAVIQDSFSYRDLLKAGYRVVYTVNRGVKRPDIAIMAFDRPYVK